MSTPSDISQNDQTPTSKRNEWPIFISYRRGDATQKIALELKKELEASTIEASTGQIFALDVFVDVAEAHQSDFQANLVPHLQHSRALIVLADDGSALRKSNGSTDYLYLELDWWATERKKTPPIILQIDSMSGSRLVADPRFLAWRRVSFMDCLPEKWAKEGENGEAEWRNLIGWILKSIKNYGSIIHLEEVKRLKLRSNIAVGLAIFAAIFGVFAVKQCNVAKYHNYKITVRLAAEEVSNGDFSVARKLLFDCPTSSRSWEWWYLLARCGPAPARINEIKNVDKQSDRIFVRMESLMNSESESDRMDTKEH
ncbi:MAG: hypothetical protein EOP04_30460 [Proteobacteria bacterium]|nr:MAG: hypothetical protein EOP04_30460 [Pseudomonadota bacterium]